MNSKENFASPQTEIKNTGKEIAPESSEVEIVKVDSEQLEQYGNNIKSYIDQQSIDFAREAEKKIESSAQSINASNELLDSAMVENNIGAQLSQIQGEADQISSEVKQEISEIVSEAPIEFSQKIGADMSWEQFFETMEKKTHPDLVQVTQEIGGLQQESSEIPLEDQKYSESSYNIDNDPIHLKWREDLEVAHKMRVSELSEIFEKAGVKSRVVEIEGGGEFSEAIILDKKEMPTEKLVRLYRGINHLDASVLEQVPYAMRSMRYENRSGKLVILENVRQEVDALAKNPTYENLLAYIDKVRVNLSPEEVRLMDDALITIEDGILNGYSTRKVLNFEQIKHGGGVGDSGLTPYISASVDSREAADYGKEGLIVMDVPLSEVEDFRTDGIEVNIKGALDKKYITAILPRKRRKAEDDKEKRNQQIHQALQKVCESVDIPLYDDETMRLECEKKLAEDTESDKHQWEKDVDAVRQKRASGLVKEFPEVKIDFQEAQQDSIEQKIDVYTKVKMDIFDQYKANLEKIGRKRKIDDHEFKSDYEEYKKFDREKITDTMLIKLRELIQRLEKREEEINKP
ncbi:MAG: hypothetical protein ACD_15C00124G0002 [uncultured bacterium]|nr:MAG: hypothetical protein ACD_15C00124G0002 [uncultured bacterium]